MSVQQDVIPVLPTTLSNVIIIPPKRRIFIIFREKS